MEQQKFKRVLLIDLDGVLNTYTGDFDKDFIPPIKDGAENFLKILSKDYEIKLFTTRNRLLASKWVFENHLDSYISDITNVKDLAYLHIDDRCLNFNGDYSSMIKQIEEFKVWYK